jgi:hypothetical protein
MRIGIVAVITAVAACGDDKRDTPFTPEEIVANATDGKAVTFEGTVHTISFDNTPTSDGGFDLKPDRFLLVRSRMPPKVRLAEDDFDSGAVLAAWGLGVRLAQVTLDDAPLPQIGAKVRVTGTFQHVEWATISAPVIEDATIEILEGQRALGLVGAACDNDLDCHEQLICDRATTRCVVPPAVEWASSYRDVNGACVTDDDCPIGQTCDVRYTMQNDGGEYAPPYFAAEDAGKHLCVLPDDATVASVCPHVYTSADLSGGRFVAGKEVCVRAETWLAVHAEDGDTHLQVTTEEPLPYPAADTPYWIFGSTTENAPPYKDPSRPQGALADPGVGDVAIAVGTMRYDADHGWWEIHPVKHYFPVSKGKGANDLDRRYKTYPEGFDAEAWEEVEGGPYKAKRSN